MYMYLHLYMHIKSYEYVNVKVALGGSFLLSLSKEWSGSPLGSTAVAGVASVASSSLSSISTRTALAVVAVGNGDDGLRDRSLDATGLPGILGWSNDDQLINWSIDDS